MTSQGVITPSYACVRHMRTINPKSFFSNMCTLNAISCHLNTLSSRMCFSDLSITRPQIPPLLKKSHYVIETIRLGRKLFQIGLRSSINPEPPPLMETQKTSYATHRIEELLINCGSLSQSPAASRALRWVYRRHIQRPQLYKCDFASHSKYDYFFADFYTLCLPQSHTNSSVRVLTSFAGFFPPPVNVFRSIV